MGRSLTGGGDHDPEGESVNDATGADEGADGKPYFGSERPQLPESPMPWVGLTGKGCMSSFWEIAGGFKWPAIAGAVLLAGWVIYKIIS